MTVNLTGATEGALRRAAALSEATRAELEADMVRLTTELAPGALRWEGAGARAFAGALAQWSEQQRAIVAALAGLRDGLLAVDQLNDSVDTAAATSLGGAA